MLLFGHHLHGHQGYRTPCGCADAGAKIDGALSGSQVRIAELVQFGCDLGLQSNSGGCSITSDQLGELSLSHQRQYRSDVLATDPHGQASGFGSLGADRIWFAGATAPTRSTRRRRTAWLGISDSNCRIRARAIFLNCRDNSFALLGGRDREEKAKRIRVRLCILNGKLNLRAFSRLQRAQSTAPPGSDSASRSRRRCARPVSADPR